MRLKVIGSLAAALALVFAATGEAAAGHARPWQDFSSVAVHHTTVNGALSVSNVLRVSSNASVYGKLYAHNGEQVWKGLLIRTNGLNVQSGGIKADAIDVAGPLQAAQGTFSGNLQAGGLSSTGSISGTTLSLTGAATVGGALTASGDLAAANLTTAGTVTAGSATIGNLQVSGSVNFANATVTGLSLSSINLQNLNLQNIALGSPTGTTAPLSLSENGQSVILGVDTTGNLTARGLSLGTTGSSTAPLLLTANGKSTSLGVDGNGDLILGATNVNGALLTTGGLTVGGDGVVQGALTVGSTGITSSMLRAPQPSGGTSPGPLSLSGSTITLNGAAIARGGLTIAGGNDFNLSTSTSNGAVSGSHMLANGDTDAAGQVVITVGSNTKAGNEVATSVTFARPYAAAPIVTVTAASDPAPGSSTPPVVWVTTSTTGFVLHYRAPANASSTYSVAYNYQVIGR